MKVIFYSSDDSISEIVQNLPEDECSIVSSKDALLSEELIEDCFLFLDVEMNDTEELNRHFHTNKQVCRILMAAQQSKKQLRSVQNSDEAPDGYLFKPLDHAVIADLIDEFKRSHFAKEAEGISVELTEETTGMDEVIFKGQDEIIEDTMGEDKTDSDFTLPTQIASVDSLATVDGEELTLGAEEEQEEGKEAAADEGQLSPEDETGEFETGDLLDVPTEPDALAEPELESTLEMSEQETGGPAEGVALDGVEAPEISLESSLDAAGETPAADSEQEGVALDGVEAPEISLESSLDAAGETPAVDSEQDGVALDGVEAPEMSLESSLDAAGETPAAGGEQEGVALDGGEAPAMSLESTMEAVEETTDNDEEQDGLALDDTEAPDLNLDRPETETEAEAEAVEEPAAEEEQELGFSVDDEITQISAMEESEEPEEAGFSLDAEEIAVEEPAAEEAAEVELSPAEEEPPEELPGSFSIEIEEEEVEPEEEQVLSEDVLSLGAQEEDVTEASGTVDVLKENPFAMDESEPDEGTAEKTLHEFKLPTGDESLSDVDIQAKERLAQVDAAYEGGDMVRTQITLRHLKEEREELLKEIERLKERNKDKEQETLGLRAELDDAKIEISILKKRHATDLEDANYKLRLSEEKKSIYEEKVKKYQHEFERLNEKVRMDFNQVKRREKELEGRLELVTMDAETQMKTRDEKILELKRKIDSLEFNMENIAIKEQKSKEDKVKIQERLDHVMKTLRTSVKVLEDDLDLDSDLIDKLEKLDEFES